jgi:SAM-dependent methyltransferase
MSFRDARKEARRLTQRQPLTPMGTLRWSVVHRLIDETRPATVLEVGCGQGGFGARLAERAQYVGCEPDAESFAVAKRRIEPLGGLVLHGTSDLVGDHTFDLVCAFEVLEHLEDDAGALVSWAGHLDPGGALLVSVPAWPDRFGAMDELVGHYRRYTPEQLDGLLLKAGCAEVRHVLYGWPLGFALEAARDRIARHRGDARESSMAARSASSGRLFQPKRLAGAAVMAATAPFTVLQRLRPTVGTGLVAVGRRA